MPFFKSAESRAAAIAKPPTPKKIPRTVLFIRVPPLACIPYYDFLPLNPIPKIPTRIPDRLVGLGVAFFIGGTHRQRITPRRLCSPRRLPGTEGVRAMVLSEFCRRPALSRVIRDLHAVDAGETAESDTPQRTFHSPAAFVSSIRRT